MIKDILIMCACIVVSVVTLALAFVIASAIPDILGTFTETIIGVIFCISAQLIVMLFVFIILGNVAQYMFYINE